MTSIATAILVLRLLTVSQVILAAAALAVSPNPGRTRILGIVLMLGAVSYLVSSPVFDDVGLHVGPWLSLPADVVPPLLFFFTWDLFEDDRKPPIIAWVLTALYVVTAMWLWLRVGTASSAIDAWVRVPVQLIKLGFALGAIFIVWRGWESDVVERRLKLRRVFVGSIGVIVAAVIVTELVTAWRVPELADLLNMAAVFVVALVANLAFLRLNPLFVLRESRDLVPVPPEDRSLIEVLDRVMNEELAYVDHDLRIAGLAERLGVPEYQLRRTINRNLGHQNFNQFVNGYRVEAAARRLVEEPRTLILTIALDVGFRSVSSFNTAFRAHYGKTPTEYRRTELTNSRRG